MSRPRATLRVGWLALCLLGTAPAWGQRARPARPAESATPSAEEARRRRKQQGDQAMIERRHSDALVAYGELYAETRDPALLYNMARAYQGLERFPEALDHLEQFKARAPAELLARVPGLDEVVAQVRARVGELSLRITPAEARVLLRGSAVGRAPSGGPLRVNAGPARLEILLDGYYPVERDVQIGPGTVTEVAVTLMSRERSGVLSLRTTPAGALVQLDGADVGMAPVEAPLEAGPHRLRLTKPGYDPLLTQVVIAAGDRKGLDLTLARTAPLTSRWWFWAGVGAVVVTGVVLTTALLVERDPGQGNLQPGRITNALVRF